MIANVTPPRAFPLWHEQFLTMLPAITTHAETCFRNRKSEAREELVHEVIVNCLVAFERLVRLGRANLAYPSTLARYGVAQVRQGRRIGVRLNTQDVTSPYAQRRKGIVVERLDEQDFCDGTWKEILVEDRRASPADTAACRIDFQTWLAKLTAKERRIAKLLATGERAAAIARRFRLTEGRISQIRRQLQASWDEFQQLTSGPAS